MAAPETIRIVLHAQARPGLCFPCTFQPSYRSERSPPKLVCRILRSQSLPRQPFVQPLSWFLDVHDRPNSALDF